MKRRVGILSGAFDPIHDGHIALAESALEHGNLDKVFILPERVLRRKTNLTKFEYRLAMCKLATEKLGWIKVIELADDQFTIAKTLPELQARFKGRQLVFILGSDLFAHLPNWPDIEKLTNSVSFLVSIRDGHDQSIVENTAQKVDAEFALIENKFPNLSSGIIRHNLKSKSTAGLNKKVLAYIKQHKLYETASSLAA